MNFLKPSRYERWILRVLPEDRAQRWSRICGVAQMIICPVYFVAWTFSGARGWVNHHMGLGMSVFLSMAWIPLCIWNMFLSSALLAHFGETIRRHNAALVASIEAIAAQADAEIREAMGLPPLASGPAASVH